jgi:hypothetical protein
MALTSSASGGPAPTPGVVFQPSLFTRRPDPWSAFSPTAPTRGQLAQASAEGQLGMAGGGEEGLTFGPPGGVSVPHIRGVHYAYQDWDRAIQRAVDAGDFDAADRLRARLAEMRGSSIAENVARWFNTPVGLGG